MCGIVGTLSQAPVTATIYDALVQLQHRGQDAAGILTCDRRFNYQIGRGLVRDVFNKSNTKSLTGLMGLGHVRYRTSGSDHIDESQPFWLGTPFGISIAHNGQLSNYSEIRDHLNAQNHHLNTDNDSEALIHLFANGLSRYTKSENDFFAALCETVKDLFTHAKGSYSVVSCVLKKGLIAFRDPHGIRPLVIGERKEKNGQSSWLLASESTPLYGQGFELIGDVAPGELVFINTEGQMQRKVLCAQDAHPCVFEQVYFARPDAVLDNVSVYRARLRMGQNLAEAWKAKYPDLTPDIVVPIPSSANTSALSMATQLGVRYSEGLYKNPFIGRTFIMSGDGMRKRSVRHKLSPLKTELCDKKVLLVDDSIVRGNTSREIVKMVRDAGAKEVYVASACPPVKHPCFYGIDIPTKEELIANQMSQDGLKKFLGVDALLYQDIDDLVEAVSRRYDRYKNPCMACLNGCYPAGEIHT